jgi:hypothetical protein
MSDDDQPFAGRGVLPVADRLPDGDPMDGSEYLALVRCEQLGLRRLPTSHVFLTNNLSTMPSNYVK